MSFMLRWTDPWTWRWKSTHITIWQNKELPDLCTWLTLCRVMKYARLWLWWISPVPKPLWMIRNMISFYVKELLHPAQSPSWRTTYCRLSATAYSVSSQLPSIPGGRLFIRNLRTRHAVVTGTHLSWYTGFWWGKPEGKRPLGRPRCRREYNIKMDLQEVECGGMDPIDLAQERDRWRALCMR